MLELVAVATKIRGDVKVWEDLMRINATGSFLGTKHCAPLIIKSGGGAIVNISSISGVVGQGYIHPGYNASKEPCEQ